MDVKKLKNRLQILSYIQNSDWFKELENSDLMISKNEKTQVELTEEGKDPNPAPPPEQPLEPDEERSWDVVDTKVVKPDIDSLLINKPKKKKQLLRIR
jgi:hypothetical protein